MLPLLYLHGLSSGDFVPALGQFLGWAKGLSAAVITKLTEQWRPSSAPSPSAIYPLWTMCLRVRSATVRSGSGAALREVFPETREQRCWFHEIASVLAALPKSAHPGAKKALAEIWNGRGPPACLGRGDSLRRRGQVPQAVAKITDDVDELLAFYDYPAGHWIHLRTTNPIESTFATVRHRTKVTKGAGLAGGRVGDGAQADRVRRGPLAGGQRTPTGRAVRAGAVFVNGVLVQRPGEVAA